MDPQMQGASVDLRMQGPSVGPAQQPGFRSRLGLKYSKPTCNVEGLSEKELKRRRCLDTPVGSAYKKRHRKELSSATRDAVVKMYLEDLVF